VEAAPSLARISCLHCKSFIARSQVTLLERYRYLYYWKNIEKETP
jgi:hypothetical protein